MKKLFFAVLVLIGTRATAQTNANIVGVNLVPALDKNASVFYEHIFGGKVGLRPFITFPFVRKSFETNTTGIVLGGGIDLKFYFGDPEKKLRFYLGPSIAGYQSRYYTNNNMKYYHLLANTGLAYFTGHLAINGGVALGLERESGRGASDTDLYYRFELGIGYSF